VRLTLIGKSEASKTAALDALRFKLHAVHSPTPQKALRKISTHFKPSMSNDKDHFEILLAQLCQRLGMPAMTFDDKHFCHFEIDDERLVTLRRDVESESVVLLAQIDSELSEVISSKIWEAIFSQLSLEFQHSEFKFGYIDKQNFVLIHRAMPIGETSADALFEAFKNLLALQLKLTHCFEEEIAKFPPNSIRSHSPRIRLNSHTLTSGSSPHLSCGRNRHRS
jgi:hypothetical protein